MWSAERRWTPECDRSTRRCSQAFYRVSEEFSSSSSCTNDDAVIKLLKRRRSTLGQSPEGGVGGTLNSGVNVELVHQCDGHLSRR